MVHKWLLRKSVDSTHLSCVSAQHYLVSANGYVLTRHLNGRLMHVCIKALPANLRRQRSLAQLQHRRPGWQETPQPKADGTSDECKFAAHGERIHLTFSSGRMSTLHTSPDLNCSNAALTSCKEYACVTMRSSGRFIARSIAVSKSLRS